MTSLNKTPLGALFRLGRQPPTRWILAGEAAYELIAMKALVTFFPPARYASLLGAHESWPKDRVPTAVVRDLIWAIESVGRSAPNAISCLPRALALQRMLKRRGVSGMIRFGAKRQDGTVRMHAWLELEEKVLVGGLPDLADYERFSGWPGVPLG